MGSHPFMLGLSLREYLHFWSTVVVLRTFAWIAVLRARYKRRGLGLVPLDVPVRPDRVIYVPSTYEKRRKIRVDVYEPPEASQNDTPRAVHINLHGSGFVVNLLGADGEICYWLSRKLNCVVLDADYAKAPERPYPHALEDVLSVITFAQTQPQWLDRERITTGGFSAGGNLALVAAAALPPGDIKAVVPWYPPCDLRHGVREEVAPVAGEELPGDGPGAPLTMDNLVRVFSKAYMPDGTDASDPRINPMCCDSARFPPVTMVVGTKDPLYPDCVAFCNKLKRAGQEADIMVIPRAQHAWERFCQKGTVFWDLREEAFRRTEQRLRSAQNGKSDRLVGS